MTSENELLPVDKVEILEHLRSEDALTPLVDKVKDLVSNFEHDLSTKTGQKKTASISRKVSNFKVRVVDIVNDYTADEKARLKKITSNLTSFKKGMDEQRDIARQPLTDFEAEEARKAAEEKERLKAQAIAKEKERDHELAIWEDREFDRVKAEEAAELIRIAEEAEAARKRQQAKHDAEIAAKAKADAEAREKAAVEAKEKAERDALVAAELAKKQAEQAEADRIRAAEKAEQDRITAEEEARQAAIKAKAWADQNAKDAAERARLDEIARRQAEEKRIADEKAKLEKNRAHVSKISKAAKEHIMLVDGVSEDLAIAIVKHLRKNKINEISINF